MPRHDPSMEELIRLAPHYIAIGHIKHNLGRPSFGTKEHDLELNSVWEENLPWERVIGIENGASWRWGVPINLVFIAPHPCGLTFTWDIDLEPRNKSMSNLIQYDWPKIRRVLARLNPEMQRVFGELFSAHVLESDYQMARAYTYYKDTRIASDRLHTFAENILGEEIKTPHRGQQLPLDETIPEERIER